jgi:decaprenylphospho-beta-D-erythro-pentofuranosid-2-ulose 2-reductase
MATRTPRTRPLERGGPRRYAARMPAERIVIFGATSAIAQALCHRYAARGARLALVGRDPHKLAALAAELGTSVVLVRAQDFCNTEQSAPLVAEAAAALGGIDLALVAHGLLGDQLESEHAYAVAEQIVHVNYLSVLALLIPLANRLETQRHGQLAVISSVAAERGRPRNYTYASAKAALNVFLEGLRSRLYPSGVSVHTIRLGPVDTPMTATHTKNRLFATVDEAASGILSALARGTAEPFVPRYWGLIMPVVRNLPEPLFQRVRSLSGR